MRATLALVFLAFVATPAVALPLEFRIPGELEASTLEARGVEWVLLIFDGAEAELKVTSLEDARLHNDTRVHAARIDYEENTARIPGPPQGSSTTVEGPFNLTSIFRSGNIGSLLLVGPGLRFDSGRSHAAIVGKPASESLEEFGQVSQEYQDVYDHSFMTAHDDVVTAIGSGVPTSFSLDGRISSATFYNAEVKCNSPIRECPTGGGPQATRVQPIPGYAASAERHTFETLLGEMDVRLDGTFSRVLVGSQNLSVLVEGSARLPLARTLDTECSTCQFPDDQTVWVWGNVSLSEMVLTSAGTISAGLGGDVEQARLDEMSVDPDQLLLGGGVLVGATTVVLLLVASKYLLGVLFTRRTDEDLLENPRRRRIYDFVVQNPGVHFREALRGANVPAGAGRHHVNRLVAAGLLTSRRQGASMLLFENHGKYEMSWQDVAATRDDSQRRLLDWLSLNPDSTQKAILDAFQEQMSWNRSTTQKRLDRLEALSVITSRSHGRFKLYKTARVAIAGNGHTACVPSTDVQTAV